MSPCDIERTIASAFPHRNIVLKVSSGAPKEVLKKPQKKYNISCVHKAKLLAVNAIEEESVKKAAVLPDNLCSLNDESGVSLNYILSPTFVEPEGYQWFVLRVPYGKEREVAATIQSPTLFSYAPVQTLALVRNGKRAFVEKSALPNMFFAYGREQELQYWQERPIVLKDHPDWQPRQLRFMYDHTRKNDQGYDRKMTVPFEQMRHFIRVTMQRDEHVRVYLNAAFSAKQGDYVEVIEGKFAGVRGRVARLHGQTCVLVELDGICVASTAYVPKAFLKKINL